MNELIKKLEDQINQLNELANRAEEELKHKKEEVEEEEKKLLVYNGALQGLQMALDLARNENKEAEEI